MNSVNIAMLATNLELNGISSVIMNYARHLNRDKYNLTIIAGKNIDPDYRAECLKMNINIIELPHRLANTKGYYYGLYRALKKNNFDIFHVHGSSSTLAIDLAIAKIAGIRVRIAHSHNTTTNNMRLHKILTPLFNSLYTAGFACGVAAGKWMFGEKDFVVIPNGFDTKKFIFSNKIREKVRKNMNIENNIVLGHIGRFNRQKNHIFILKVFNELMKINSNYKLLLVGDGPDFEKFRDIVAKSKNKDNIILYGETDNPNEIYMAMDKFILPSLYEGLPIVLLEAQIAGLPIIASDVITEEVKLSNHFIFESLESSPKNWAYDIDNIDTTIREREIFFDKRKDTLKKYEIVNSVKILEGEYDKLVKLYIK